MTKNIVVDDEKRPSENFADKNQKFVGKSKIGKLGGNASLPPGIRTPLYSGRPIPLLYTHRQKSPMHEYYRRSVVNYR